MYGGPPLWLLTRFSIWAFVILTDTVDNYPRCVSCKMRQSQMFSCARHSHAISAIPYCCCFCVCLADRSLPHTSEPKPRQTVRRHKIARQYRRGSIDRNTNGRPCTSTTDPTISCVGQPWRSLRPRRSGSCSEVQSFPAHHRLRSNTIKRLTLLLRLSVKKPRMTIDSMKAR